MHRPIPESARTDEPKVLARPLEVLTSGERWDWPQLLACWNSALRALQFNPAPAFLELNVYDAANLDALRPPALSWWPAAEVQRRHENLQWHLLSYPGTPGPLHPPTARSRAARALRPRDGEKFTLRHLYRAREDSERVAAIIISSSLFARMGPYRGRKLKWHPNFACVDHVERLAYSHWQGGVKRRAGRRRHGWDILPSSIEPQRLEEYLPGLTYESLVRHLAREHVALFTQHRPVLIHFVDTCDEKLQERWRAQRTAQAQREQALKSEREAKEWPEARRARLAAHPRCESWDHLPFEELKALVWSVPPGELVQQFGISRAALAKCCRRWGLARPSFDFWPKKPSLKLPKIKASSSCGPRYAR